MPERGTAARRLESATLGSLPPDVAVPTYDRAAVGQAIVHLSLGAFHRAHQALYLDELLAQGGDPAWGVCGVGLLAQDGAVGEALRAQDLLYTLVERDAAVESARVVGALRGYLHAPSEPEAVVARLADPATRLVTLTVTEGGYYLDESTGELAADDPQLRHDLERTDEPSRSIWGLLAAALDRRRRAGAAPFTVLSCDNLPGNGTITARLLTRFAALCSPDLGRWVEANVAFPGSMVDRITPVTSGAHRERVRALLGGVEDACPVVTEPFRQWIVEDRFGNGRPALERVGVQLVADVQPYERMKLGLLNGAHQALAHVGRLLGHGTTDVAMRDPLVRRLCERYMATVQPLVAAPPGIDLDDYRRTLLGRFSNPEIRDALARIATDASSRLPKFVLPFAREQLARSGPVTLFALVVAAWMRGLAAADEPGAPPPVDDPRHDALRARVPPGQVDPRPLLHLREVFGDLGGDPRFATAVAIAFEGLRRDGCATTVEAALAVS